MCFLSIRLRLGSVSSSITLGLSTDCALLPLAQLRLCTGCAPYRLIEMIWSLVVRPQRSGPGWLFLPLQYSVQLHSPGITRLSAVDLSLHHLCIPTLNTVLHIKLVVPTVSLPYPSLRWMLPRCSRYFSLRRESHEEAAFTLDYTFLKNFYLREHYIPAKDFPFPLAYIAPPSPLTQHHHHPFTTP